MAACCARCWWYAAVNPGSYPGASSSSLRITCLERMSLTSSQWRSSLGRMLPMYLLLTWAYLHAECWRSNPSDNIFALSGQSIFSYPPVKEVHAPSLEKMTRMWYSGRIIWCTASLVHVVSISIIGSVIKYLVCTAILMRHFSFYIIFVVLISISQIPIKAAYHMGKKCKIGQEYWRNKRPLSWARTCWSGWSCIVSKTNRR